VEESRRNVMQLEAIHNKAKEDIGVLQGQVWVGVGGGGGGGGGGMCVYAQW